MPEYKKRKLSFDEQIAYMRDNKNIGFSIIGVKAAREFLSNHNYYFRVKSYAKNYEQYVDSVNGKKGKYIELEFAYLKELSILDMHFKNIAHKMLGAIEHFSKIQLLRDFEDDEGDGYYIVKEFFRIHENTQILAKVIRNQNGYSGGLIRKCCPIIPVTVDNQNFALWNIIEVLSFGELISFYTFYSSRYSKTNRDVKHIVNILWSARMLRNAIAHDNCLLNSLKDGYSNKKFRSNKKLNSFIQKRVPSISATTRKQRLANPVVHDFAATIHLFNEIVSSKEIRKERMLELQSFLSDRCLLHSKYFEKNTILVSTYNFFNNLVEYYSDYQEAL